MLVCVPKILDVLREHVERTGLAPTARFAPAGGPLPLRIARRWWHYRRIHRAFGWKFWAFVVGAAPLDARLERVMGDRVVGVLGVELFVVDGRLVVNEIAPRPHNSGHWTLDEIGRAHV